MSIDEWLSIYDTYGIKIIPAYEGEKVPFVDWKKYEETPPSKEQIKKWFTENPESNLAVLCGKPSGNLVVLDFDKLGMYEKFFPKHKELEEWTWVVNSPHGVHVYLRPDKEIKSFKIQGYVEVRSTGNIVICPPSTITDRNTGKKLEYAFKSRPDQIRGITDLENAINKQAKELGAQIRESETDKWITTNFAGWTGTAVPCIKTLVESPAPKGERDERAVRIAAYYANFCQNSQEARDKIDHWFANVEQPPNDPFTLNQARSKIEWVRAQGYNYGCNDYLLKSMCRPGICWFALQRNIKNILQNKEILNEICKFLDVLIAGEEANKLLLFLLCLSGKCKDWQKKQIILLQGEPGGGKTTLANNITKLYKTKKVGRFSRHALDYSDLQGYEILYLQELGDMDKEDEGLSTLKFLSADDKGYIVEITVRDPDTGEFVTQEKTIPPITVVTTTTRAEVDPQLARRAWPLAIDESIEQTKRVRKHKVNDKWEDNFLLLGWSKEKRAEIATQYLQKLVNELKDCDILIPYPETLFTIFKDNTQAHIQLRGNFDKLWNLVWLLCFLMQKQLPTLLSNPTSVLLASPIATAEMLQIIEDPLLKMSSEIGKHDQTLFAAMESCGITEEGDVIDLGKRGRIAEKALLSEDTIYKRLKRLARRTPLFSTKKESQQVHFVLCASIEEIKESIGEIVGVLKSPTDLALKFIEEAENTLNTSSAKLCQGIPLNTTLDKIRRVLENERISLIQRKETETVGESKTPPLPTGLGLKQAENEEENKCE